MISPHAGLLKLIILRKVMVVQNFVLFLDVLRLILRFGALRRWEQFVCGDLREGQLVDEVVDQHFPGLFDSG